MHTSVESVNFAVSIFNIYDTEAELSYYNNYACDSCPYHSCFYTCVLPPIVDPPKSRHNTVDLSTKDSSKGPKVLVSSNMFRTSE